MQIHINSLLFAFSKALDFVEADLLGITTNHSKRVAYISMQVAKNMGFRPEEVSDLASCAILHDNALTQYMLAHKDGLHNLENIQSHCTAGEANAKDFPFISKPQKIILHHHENWDGTGFFHLKGYEFSETAAIVRLADNIDLRYALGTETESRIDKVCEHVKNKREEIYAPQVVDAFLSCINANFIADLGNARIDQALVAITPPIISDLSTATLLQMSKIFSQIIDAKSKFTLRHSKGIANIAEIMSKYYSFTPDRLNKFIMAAHLHDIGKLTIPNALLDKPGPLTKEEFKIVKGHAQASYDILSLIKGLEDITAWACGHHEKLDGSGYPFGLKAEQICFETRLLTCIDIYQALTENRPYRYGMGHSQAIAILQEMVYEDKIDAQVVLDLDSGLNELSHGV